MVKEQNPNIEIGVMPVPYHKNTDRPHRLIPYRGFRLLRQYRRGRRAGRLPYIAGRVFTDGERSGVIPQRASVLERFPAFAEPPLKLFIDTIRQWAVPRPLTPGYSEYDAIYETLLADVATGAPVEDTVNAAAQAIDAQLAKYAELVGS
ncbi:MAG: hypothetical protein IPK19_10560 [Chloroflexi bacterium]|nr:hypothetical protein [Chloroflexota bacterium]